MRSEQLGFLKNSFSTPSLCSGTWSAVQIFGLGFDSQKKALLCDPLCPLWCKGLVLGPEFWVLTKKGFSL